MRWVTSTPTEAQRIQAAHTRHGTLNSSARRAALYTRQEVGELAAQCIQRIRTDERKGRTTAQDAQRAVSCVRRACEELRQRKVQKQERVQRKRPRATREVWCYMNKEMLEILADAEAGGASPRVCQSAQRQLDQGEDMGDGSIRVLRTYTFSELGRDLYEAGHVAGSREYAVGGEPFKWSCDERAMAYHGLGHECDDSAAYPRARMAMTAAGRDISATFLQHRKHIMRTAGAYLFAEADEEDRMKYMKAVTNAFDMDSALDAWTRRYGNPHGRTLRGHTVALPDGTPFSLQAYRAAQVHTTAWMAARLQSMVALIQSLRKVGSPEHTKAPRTAKSFILQ